MVCAHRHLGTLLVLNENQHFKYFSQNIMVAIIVHILVYYNI